MKAPYGRAGAPEREKVPAGKNKRVLRDACLGDAARIGHLLFIATFDELRADAAQKHRAVKSGRLGLGNEMTGRGRNREANRRDSRGCAEDHGVPSGGRAPRLHRAASGRRAPERAAMRMAPKRSTWGKSTTGSNDRREERESDRVDP